MELWVLPDAGTASSGGTLISHGDLNQSMELALTTDNFLEVTVGGKTVRSEQPLPAEPGEWAHVARGYHASGSDAGHPGNAAGAPALACHNFGEVLHKVQDPA